MSDTTAMHSCPMAHMCRGMMEKPKRAGSAMIWPGLILIALGIAIIVWPMVLAWLVAAFFIIMGFGVLWFASKVRNMPAPPMHSQGSS